MPDPRRNGRSASRLLGRLAVGCALAASTARADVQVPVALLLESPQGRLQRAGAESFLSAQPGEVLFVGDRLRAVGQSVALLNCGERVIQVLSAGGELSVEDGGARVRTGTLVRRAAAVACPLPPVERTPSATQAHAGLAPDGEARGNESEGSLAERRRSLPEDKRRALEAELAGLSDGRDPLALLARATALERAGLAQDAAAALRSLSVAWPEAAWVRSRGLVLEKQAAKPAPAPAPEPAQPELAGRTHALLIGISDFQRDTVPRLRFAHEDAISIAALLRSPRGGGLAEEDVLLLQNERATTAAIRDAIESRLKARAGPNDTVLLFVATHGVVVPEGGKPAGYIVTYDSDPEDLATTAIPMADIRRLFEDELAAVRRVIVYVDVCRAGKIGETVRIGQIERSEAKTYDAARGLVPEEQLFGLLAAQKGQAAIESAAYGGGHGVFSYFLLRGLNGDADFNGDDRVTMDEFSRYVTDKVPEATAGKQIPKQIGDIDETRVMAVKTRPGIDLGPVDAATLTAGRGDPRGVAAPPPVVIPPLGRELDSARALRYRKAEELVRDLERAVTEVRLLPGEDRSAFAYLQALKLRLRPGQYDEQADLLRVALEDRGQQVLLRYLAGEREPQAREDFLRGLAYFEAAQLLARDSPYLQGRAAFFQGRVAMFDKRYDRAIEALERAVRLDPERAYAYNALGIAYLEQADFERAIAALRDATRRAPYWAYPRHNLALALAETGDYTSAIDSYRLALDLLPTAAYLHYNLGLLYQRLDRRRDAETALREALRLEPDNPEVHNALGTLHAAWGRRAAAEAAYGAALQRRPGMVTARHNLAVLLASTPARTAEAMALWREALRQQPNFLASRLSLAKALTQAGEAGKAAAEYEEVVRLRPDYVAARMALASLHQQLGQGDAARRQLQEALRREPDNGELHEQLGDVEAASGRRAEAESAWRRALSATSERGVRRRLERKLRSGGRA